MTCLPQSPKRFLAPLSVLLSDPRPHTRPIHPFSLPRPPAAPTPAPELGELRVSQQWLPLTQPTYSLSVLLSSFPHWPRLPPQDRTSASCHFTSPSAPHKFSPFCVTAWIFNVLKRNSFPFSFWNPSPPPPQLWCSNHQALSFLFYSRIPPAPSISLSLPWPISRSPSSCLSSTPSKSALMIILEGPRVHMGHPFQNPGLFKPVPSTSPVILSAPLTQPPLGPLPTDLVVASLHTTSTKPWIQRLLESSRTHSWWTLSLFSTPFSSPFSPHPAETPGSVTTLTPVCLPCFCFTGVAG